MNFVWGKGGEGLSKMKLTIEEGPNGPVKGASRGPEVGDRGRGGGHQRVVMTLQGAWTQRSKGGVQVLGR